MAIEDDIRLMQQEMMKARDADDFKLATNYAKAIFAAQQQLQQQPQLRPQGEPPVEMAGLLGSVGLGAQRQAGRFGAGIKEVGSLTGIGSGGFLSPESIEERRALAESERGKESVFSQRTADHPIAAGVGEAKMMKSLKILLRVQEN